MLINAFIALFNRCRSRYAYLFGLKHAPLASAPKSTAPPSVFYSLKYAMWRSHAQQKERGEWGVEFLVYKRVLRCYDE